MTDLRHNGGPSLDDVKVPDMTYFKLYPSDFLNGFMHLTLELRGAYVTALFTMYDRMGGFPYDEEKGAVLMRVDKRVYRRVRDALIADGKFYVDGDMIRNGRVEKEITEYVREYQRRSEAAKAREAKLRLQRTSGELRSDLSGTSAELPGEVREKSGELEAKNQIKTTKIEPQEGRILEARSQKLEARYKKEKKDICAAEAAPCDPQLENEDDQSEAAPGLPPLVLESFETFWKLFPAERRRGKGKCREIFANIVLGRGKYTGRKMLAATLIQAVKAGAGIDPKFPPMPETWLNQGRWEDAPVTAEPSAVDGKSWGWWRGQEAKYRNLPMDRWRRAFASQRPNGTWPWWLYGPPPGDPECLVPRELIEEHNWEQVYRGSITHD